MTVQEKFDGIIDCIEHLVDIGESDIPQMLSRETGMNLRLIGDAFQFIADMTLIKYIRQRRLVKALQKRFDFDLPIEQIVSTAGFSDAAEKLFFLLDIEQVQLILYYIQHHQHLHKMYFYHQHKCFLNYSNLRMLLHLSMKH